MFKRKRYMKDSLLKRVIQLSCIMVCLQSALYASQPDAQSVAAHMQNGNTQGNELNPNDLQMGSVSEAERDSLYQEHKECIDKGIKSEDIGTYIDSIFNNSDIWPSDRYPIFKGIVLSSKRKERTMRLFLY